MKKFLIIVGIIILVILAAWGFFKLPKTKIGNTPAQTNNLHACDIRNVDFGNYKIDTDQFGEIDLKNNMYVQKDDVGNLDWEFTLTSSSTLYTFGSDTIKIIYVTSSHLSGSGEWEVALGYACSDGKVAKALEQGSISQVTISKRSNNQLELKWGEGYQGTNPPEKELTRVVQWNHEQSKFVDVK